LKKKVSFISLGCFKNVVDTEVLGGLLEQRGMEIVSGYEKSDYLIINTCGFVRDAKEESIEEILTALEEKEKGDYKKIVAFGCLIERYYKDLKENFKNIDLLWGNNNLEKLADLISKDENEDYSYNKLFLYDHNYKRITITTPNSRFIKISEGCNMKCSFCAIPQIRGEYRSRDIDSILIEAENLIKSGVKEITLISQNSTYFGKDKGKESQLPELLKRLSELGVEWIRVLYLMPEEVNDEILDGFNNKNVLPYFDLPFQHVSKKIIKLMNRNGDFNDKLNLVKKIRKNFKNAVIRSSFIVGFPQEDDDDFELLKEFVKESKIERIGVFGYSNEENTKAFELEGQIDPYLIEMRKEELMDLSDKNIIKYNKKIREKEFEFLPLGSWENNNTIGRIWSQAPEVDGFTIINSRPDKDNNIIKIKVYGYDNEVLFGEKL